MSYFLMVITKATVRCHYFLFHRYAIVKQQNQHDYTNVKSYSGIGTCSHKG